jgi:hypothetical protein
MQFCHQRSKLSLKAVTLGVLTPSVMQKYRVPSMRHHLLLIPGHISICFLPPCYGIFLQETNRYAAQFLAARETLSQRSRVRQWREVTVTEMKVFLAILLEMGITKRPTIFSYWAKNSRTIPWFSKMMTRDHFQLLLRFF